MSQICHYFEHFLYIMWLLKQLITVGRDDDWESHLHMVQNILRYGSLYLDQMQRLPEDYLDICGKSMNGLFLVKQKSWREVLAQQPAI